TAVPLPVESAFSNWHIFMRTWVEVREFLDRSRVMELPQASLSLQTSDAVSRLTAFLNLDEAQAEGVRAYLVNERPEHTGSSDDREDLFLEDTEWPLEVREWCKELCEEMASEWGYRLCRSRS